MSDRTEQGGAEVVHENDLNPQTLAFRFSGFSGVYRKFQEASWHEFRLKRLG